MCCRLLAFLNRERFVPDCNVLARFIDRLLVLGLEVLFLLLLMCVRVFSTCNPSVVYGCACVVHIKPSFLPVDIHHTQCPCRVAVLKRHAQALWLQNHDAEILT